MHVINNYGAKKKTNKQTNKKTNLPLKYPNVRVAVIKNNCYKMLSCMIPERWFFGGFFGGWGGDTQ